jgi:Zn-dependent protease
MIELTLIQKIAVYALPVVFAITLHEAAHGYAARYFGDNTAYLLGRISLNPLRHIDPVGTVLVPLLTMLVGGILFGWAKPVPVNFSNLRQPKKDMLWVAAAGPASNLAMAIGWALVMKISTLMPESSLSLPMALMGKAGVSINAVLLVLNLLPLPPLDGGRIMVSLLPNRLAWRFAALERYGFFILIALLFLGALDFVLWPLINLTVGTIFLLFGI